MGVFKEEVYQLQSWSHRQERIYEDACDYGILATDEIKKRMKEILLALPELVVTEKINSRTQICRQYNSKVWWEPGNGVNIGIGYVKDLQRKKEFFTIYMVNLHTSEEEGS